jgi:hypothetical protein
MDLSREKLAVKIASELPCEAKVWAKSNKVRIYLSHRGIDLGFLAVNDDGLEYALNGNPNPKFEAMIQKAIEGVNIIPDDGIKTHHGDCRDATTKALDAMYGRGGWDDRDREDYEG